MKKMRKFEFENAILRKNLLKVNGKQFCSRDISFTYSSRMTMHLKQDKNSNILRHLNFSMTEFRKTNVRVNCTAFAKGVFGSVFKGCIISSNQHISVKKVSSKCRLVDVQAECKKAMVMAGHEIFLFVFGFMAPRYILMELLCEANGSCCPTLRKFLAHCTVPLRIAIKIAINMCIAIHELHAKGLLHNDLHSGNILVRNSSHVKIIDFGKSTLVTDPLRYDIELQSKQHEKFNTIHLFLAYELHNIRGSFQIIASDVYPVRYNIDSIPKSLKSHQMTLLAVDMMSKTPEERPHLRRCISALEKMYLDSS